MFKNEKTLCVSKKNSSERLFIQFGDRSLAPPNFFPPDPLPTTSDRLIRSARGGPPLFRFVIFSDLSPNYRRRTPAKSFRQLRLPRHRARTDKYACACVYARGCLRLCVDLEVCVCVCVAAAAGQRLFVAIFA